MVEPVPPTELWTAAQAAAADRHTMDGLGVPSVLLMERAALSVAREVTANIEGLGLEEAGVALTPNGGIEVDDRMRTSKAGVYAAGDVTGRDLFVYMAAYGAKIAAHNALNGDGRRYDNLAMPAVVFTDPQVASVGLTEAAAKADPRCWPWPARARSWSTTRRN